MKRLLLTIALTLLPVAVFAQGAGINTPAAQGASIRLTFPTTVQANVFCLDQTTKDSYFAEVGANNPGAYTGGTACAGGALRFDWNSTRFLFAVPAQLAAGGSLSWTGRSVVTSTADGRLILTNNAASAGAGLDFATDGTLKIVTTAGATASTEFNSSTINGSINMIGNGNISLQGGQLLGPSNHVLWKGTTPTNPVACTTPTVTWNNGTAAFQVDVGTICAGVSTLVVTLPAVTNAWSCHAMNVGVSATAEVEMTASDTTSATFTNYTRTTGLVLVWTDGSDVRIGCWGG